MRKLIIANWKMHPDTADEAAELAADIEKELSSPPGADVVIAPPLPFLMSVAAVLKKSLLGAQDMAEERDASLTGGVSWRVLKSLNVRFVIIGHSERRIRLGETDEAINQKVRTALAHGFCAILCVGEQEAGAGDIPLVVSDQVHSALAGIKKELLKNLVVAYEPVWAISTTAQSTGADTPERMFRARLTIEKAIAAIFDAAAAKKVRIVYGGSVTPENIATVMAVGHMDGALVGGASLNAEEFGEIVSRAVAAKR
ncbi:MAG: triose-phosphate isomerase [Candidatus Sungiibacteriota bacterium]